jgi:hypothetical protein
VRVYARRGAPYRQEEGGRTVLLVGGPGAV